NADVDQRAGRAAGMIFGFTPPGSDGLGAVFLTVTTTVFTLYFLVGGLGWAVMGGRIELPPGTAVDLGLPRWRFLLDQDGPPIDAVPLTQYTYDFMTNNNGVIGLGYPYWAVRYGSGIIPVAGDYGPLFRLGTAGSGVLGGGHVLG